MNDDLNRTWEALVAYADRERAQAQIPGLALGLLYQDRQYTAGLGVTHLDHPLPVTPETLFQIGSITKTVSATLVMRLVEAGKLALEAPVRGYLPEFRVADESASAGATLRHLLTHTAGWTGDFFRDTGAGDDALTRYVALMAQLEQLAPLGTHISYCNSGFYLLGAVIERVTGRPFEAVARELVLEPLGMDHALFDPGDVMLHRFAVGHSRGAGGMELARPWPLPRAAYAAGGIACPVTDLLRYARFHLGDGRTGGEKRLLRPESLALMQRPQAPFWRDQSCGLSWWLRDQEGVQIVDHGGGTMGQVSLLTLVPERGFALATLTNSGEGGALNRALWAEAARTLLGLTVPRPEPIEAAEADLLPFVGRYRRPLADLELGLLGGRLVGQVTYKEGFPSQDSPVPPPPPPASLALCEPDRLLVMDGPMKESTVDVLRRPDGAINWLRLGLRLFRKLKEGRD